jgi:hypothetical protein
LTGNRHSQRIHPSEVGGGQDARRMDLREEHFLPRALRTAPMSYAPFECPPLRVGEPTRIGRGPVASHTAIV